MVRGYTVVCPYRIGTAELTVAALARHSDFEGIVQIVQAGEDE